jgi:hypothetical protein
MSTYTALTVPTQFVEGNGIRFAYRRWGKQGGVPLVFMQYFSGNLDDWDPLVTDGFAADYDVTLVVHGNKDIVVLPINAFLLAEHPPDAQLIVYPDSSHGAQYQHAELFLKHAKLFLSNGGPTS